MKNTIIQHAKQFAIKTTIWLISGLMAYMLIVSALADNELQDAEQAFHDTATIYNQAMDLRKNAEKIEVQALKAHNLAKEKLRIIKEQKGIETGGGAF
jgi:hypothetical protein